MVVGDIKFHLDELRYIKMPINHQSLSALVVYTSSWENQIRLFCLHVPFNCQDFSLLMAVIPLSKYKACAIGFMKEIDM